MILGLHNAASDDAIAPTTVGIEHSLVRAASWARHIHSAGVTIQGAMQFAIAAGFTILSLRSATLPIALIAPFTLLLILHEPLVELIREIAKRQIRCEF